MDAPPSNPSPSSPHPRPLVAQKGTLLGFPALLAPAAAPPRSEPPSARSVAYDFERWSTPPPNGLAPIVPCDEPDDEDVWQWMPPRASAPTVAVPRTVPATLIMAPIVAIDDPVILPTRNRDASDRRFRVWLCVAIVCAGMIALALRLLV